MKTGTVSINAENIMPVIKQWLYSDKDIFAREMISNACDAISKHKHLAATGQAPADEAPYRIDVVVDKKNGTLSFSDNGIGMTADEVEKYISQVAFSGANEFISQYQKDDGDDAKIIGHFGLGFYSVFMVSDHVEIDTKSWQDAPAVKWLSDDGMEYEVQDSDRTARGTTITLHLDSEDAEFLDQWKIREVLEKHCAFMPYPIYLTEVKEEKPEEETAEATGEDKKDEAEKEEPKPVNDTNPLWMRKPADCTDEDYKAFYRKVFHDFEEPLFWIHLNAEYPFNLKGILYFPKIRNEFTASEGIVKLYNNQVFVADNIKEVIPDFLLLLKGAIDCPDLPLNVSRSFLQNDGYVKKMSAYITRKVADRLVSEFNDRREDYQRYWDDIHPFVKYGCIRDEKFYDRVKNAILYKTTSGKFMTLEEYRNANCDEDKPVVLYTDDEKRQAQMVALYTQQGKDVIILNSMIDANFISFLEYSEKDQKIAFKRVDAAADALTEGASADEDRRKALEARFRKALNEDDLEVELRPFKDEDTIAMVTVDESNRRFAEMSARWNFKEAPLPQKRTLVVNERHPLIAWIAGADEGDKSDSVCRQVVDLAELARQPLVAERMVEFLKRSNALLTQLVTDKD